MAKFTPKAFAEGDIFKSQYEGKLYLVVREAYGTKLGLVHLESGILYDGKTAYGTKVERKVTTRKLK